MLVESAIAFLLILLSASLIYVLGRRASPKPTQSENERAEYACGERAPIQKLKISITLYRYLIYFTIFDSSILLLAFAALGHGINMTFLIVYLSILFVSSLLLLEGGNE
ncbi:MAG: NADH-quinone oxidoreductase subunit A [Candidatus Bathyarchaeota archaeon]|nr:NADH-quinone oxidoreductase subunit A [Candidatus Bathyarchaeota archaeon]